MPGLAFVEKTKEILLSHSKWDYFLEEISCIFLESHFRTEREKTNNLNENNFFVL